MSGRRGPCTFRQTDVTRALRAARAAGFEHVRVEIDKDGKIAIVAGNGVDRPDEVAGENSFDQWMQHHARDTQGD
jgi:hypothetical protein